MPLKPQDHPWLIAPNLQDESLTIAIEGVDQHGKKIISKVIQEKAITLFLNGQEVITNMTIGDHPDYLAVGYLANQRMLKKGEIITQIEHDAELGVTIVRTDSPTNFEAKMKRKIHTSGCAQGTIFGDVMDEFDQIAKSWAKQSLNQTQKIKLSDLYALMKLINLTPSLYLEAGAIHGCVLCDGANPLIYMEDVGRHNAVDKISGYMVMHDMTGAGKILYTTGRLTSEMVIKCVMMGISVLISRSGFTGFGVDLARQAGLTLIGRAKGHRLTILSGESRILFDTISDDSPKSEENQSDD